jgi:hypothetical protein
LTVFEILLLALGRGCLLCLPMNHALASSPSIGRGIASFSIGRRSFLGVSFQLPILVLLLLSPGVVLESWGHAVPSPYKV